MLKASEEEIEAVREYFEWQAPDLEVTFMQKVYSEVVMNTRHDVWDSRTGAFLRARTFRVRLTVRPISQARSILRIAVPSLVQNIPTEYRSNRRAGN